MVNFWTPGLCGGWDVRSSARIRLIQRNYNKSSGRSLPQSVATSGRNMLFWKRTVIYGGGHGAVGSCLLTRDSYMAIPWYTVSCCNVVESSGSVLRLSVFTSLSKAYAEICSAQTNRTTGCTAVVGPEESMVNVKPVRSACYCSKLWLYIHVGHTGEGACAHQQLGP